MALTDVRKAKELVWCTCEIPEYNDEEFLLLPYVRDATRDVIDGAQSLDWKNNAISREFDPELFDSSWIKHMWKGCRGILDPSDPTGKTRLRGPGVVKDDGTIVYLGDPDQFTEDHKMLLVNSRPPAFYLWMQNASTKLASFKEQTTQAQRENFRGASEVPPALPAPELPGMSDTV